MWNNTSVLNGLLSLYCFVPYTDVIYVAQMLFIITPLELICFMSRLHRVSFKIPLGLLSHLLHLSEVIGNI